MVAHSDHSVHPLDTIASKFNSSGDQHLSSHDSTTDSAIENIATGVDAPPLILSRHIQSPTIILSKDLRIAWQNSLAVIRLWHHREGMATGSNHSDIFDIILSSRFQNKVRNWRQWLAFFIQQALAMISREALERLIAQKDNRQAEILQAMLTDFDSAVEYDILSGSLQQLMSEDLCISYRVIGLSFDKGRLIVFETVKNADESEVRSAQALSNSPPSILMHTHKNPVKTNFYVLCARLNDADKISDEMLAKDYGRLLNRLWGLTKDTIERHGGLFIQYESGIVIGYFISSETIEHKALNVIQCALELKSHSNELGREWKIQMSWLHDIELNMGIHSGTEHITSLPSSFGNNLLPLGNTLPQANHLSAMAQAGQIWTTKTVIDQIADDEIDNLRFGIFRKEPPRQIFIPNSFTRIRDFSADETSNGFKKDQFSSNPVTLVFDYQGNP